MEDSNCRLSKRFLHCPVTLPPTNQKKVTYPVALNPNFTYKNFSLKTTGEFGNLEYEPPILFGWPCNKLFFPTPTHPHTKSKKREQQWGTNILKQAETTLGKNEILKINPWWKIMPLTHPFNTHIQTYIPGNWKQIWKRCIHSHVYCVIAKRWKQPKTPTERWMDREKVICTHSRVLALQKEILSHGFHPTTWMKLKDSMLSKSESVRRVWLFVTPRTVAHQVPLSMEFSRQYWSGLSYRSPGDLPDPGRFFTVWAKTRSAWFHL